MRIRKIRGSPTGLTLTVSHNSSYVLKYLKCFCKKMPKEMVNSYPYNLWGLLFLQMCQKIVLFHTFIPNCSPLTPPSTHAWLGVLGPRPNMSYIEYNLTIAMNFVVVWYARTKWLTRSCAKKVGLTGHFLFLCKLTGKISFSFHHIERQWGREIGFCRCGFSWFYLFLSKAKVCIFF